MQFLCRCKPNRFYQKLFTFKEDAGSSPPSVRIVDRLILSKKKKLFTLIVRMIIPPKFRYHAPEPEWDVGVSAAWRHHGQFVQGKPGGNGRLSVEYVGQLLHGR